jgi:hypothetical protein
MNKHWRDKNEEVIFTFFIRFAVFSKMIPNFIESRSISSIRLKMLQVNCRYKMTVLIVIEEPHKLNIASRNAMIIVSTIEALVVSNFINGKYTKRK